MNFNEIIPFSEYYSLSSSIEEEQSALSMLGARANSLPAAEDAVCKKPAVFLPAGIGI